MVLGIACVASGLATLPAHADVTTYYVNNAIAACSDTGSGTLAVPFCNIQAGVNAASPGDTVDVLKPGPFGYKQPVVISKSGTAAAPITIVADPVTQVVDTGYPFIFQTVANTASFTFDGASNVKLDGFPILNYTGAPVIAVQKSSNITIDRMTYKEGSGNVTIDGASSGVTLSRSKLGGVAIGSGAANVSLIEDYLDAADEGGSTVVSPIAATNINGLTITNDTLIHGCPSAIDIEGTSHNVSIENNIVTDGWGWNPAMESGVGNCAPNSIAPPNTGDAPEITVSAGSAAHTTTDYNDIFSWQSTQDAAYSWNGVTYQTPAALTAATGQGAHDSTDSPWPNYGLPVQAEDFPTPTEGSAAIDSADANAPGLLPTDLLGNPRTDDLYIPDTGTGGITDVDRGAYEFIRPASAPPATVTASPLSGTYPFSVTATATPPGAWSGVVEYSFNFNDGTGWTLSSAANTTQHVYRTLGANSAGIDVRVTMYGATATAHDADTISGDARQRPARTGADNDLRQRPECADPGHR